MLLEMQLTQLDTAHGKPVNTVFHWRFVPKQIRLEKENIHEFIDDFKSHYFNTVVNNHEFTVHPETNTVQSYPS